jgi:hypothetical protein
MAKNRLQERTTPPPPFPLICLWITFTCSQK